LQLLSRYDGFCKGGLAFLAVPSFLVVSGHGDPTVRTRHLELVVDVACPGVELVVGGPAEDHVVGAFEGHNFKCDHLIRVIVDITEGHMKFDSTKGVFFFTRNHTMELRAAVLKLFLGKVHLLQSFQVHDVQARSAVHEALGEVIPVYAGTNNQSIVLLGLHLDDQLYQMCKVFRTT
jgi:hypothetical protein